CQAPGDNFDDNAINTMWSVKADPGMTVTEAGGLLDITFTAAPTALAYSRIATKVKHDLTSCAAFVEVDTLPSSALSSVYTNFTADDGTGNTLEFFVNVGSLSAVLWTANTPVELKKDTFDNTKHRWLRLREAAGTVFWDTSGDGKTWANFTSSTPTFSVTAMTFFLGSGTFAAEASNPGKAAFDNFNISPP
ncbi:MAG TPA: hypothetical protein PKA88_10785, partial [Polyangiaceae bacterium]|nr:hypothetical protein [Polyangiaceae bacterium]